MKIGRVHEFNFFYLFTIFVALTICFPIASETVLLENGLHLYAAENKGDALVHVTLSVNAGRNMQLAHTAGFFEFYSRLFFQAGFEALKAEQALKTEETQKSENELNSSNSTNTSFTTFQEFQAQLGMTDVSVTINDKQTVYSFTIPPDSLSQSLEFLSFAVKAPIFKKESLTTEAKTFATDTETYQTSLAGFVTGAVETRISPAFPWKTFSGTNPSVFKKADTKKLRAITDEVRTCWYVPENAELLVSGQIDSTDFFNLAEKHLIDWKSGSIQFTTYRNNQVEDTNKTLRSTPFPSGKKYLLVSNGLSSQLLQLIVVYDTLNFPQNVNTSDNSDEFLQFISVMMNQNSSPFKIEAVTSPTLNISSPYDINISTRSDTGIRRLVVQALLTPAEDLAIDAQATEFIKLFETSFIRTLSALTTETIASTVPSVSSDTHNSSTDNSISDNLQVSSDVQVSQFDEINLGTPLTFIALNTDLYTEQKKTFTTNNWSIVTEKEAYWFNMKEYKSYLSNSGITFSDNNGNDVSDKDLTGEILTAAERYATVNVPLFSSFTLSNGIPVFTKLQTSETTAVLIELTSSDITTGTASTDNQKTNKLGTFSAVLEIFANWIQASTGCYVKTQVIPLLQNQSSVFQGTLSFECPNDYVQTALQRTIDSLIFGQITPVEADEIIYALQTEHVQQTGTIDGRLKTAAFQTFFGDSSVTQQMDILSSLYNGIKYNDLLSLITELLDASCYRLILCGGDSDFQSKVEPFTILKNHGNRQNRELEPDFVLTRNPENAKPTDNTDKPEQSMKNRILSSVILKGPENLKSVAMLDLPDTYLEPQETHEMREVFVPIKRVYASAMPVDKTTKKSEVRQPLTLKETTIFYDPVQFYLKAPHFSSNTLSTEQVVFDALVTELESVISQQLKALFPTDSLRNPTFSIESISVLKENSFPDFYIALKFTDVTDYKVIKTLLKSSLETVITSCKSLSDSNLQTLKNRTLVKKLSATSTVTGTAFLMFDGLQSTGKTGSYIDWYNKLEKSTSDDLCTVAEEYFDYANVLGVFAKTAE